MKKHLRALQPNRFEDLVAMNALYRPGPMEYIPSFIRRKHGEEPIEYDHPMMEPYLKDTYGITVYQEQVMLQSRALGLFTRGQSDTLRKAMGRRTGQQNLGRLGGFRFLCLQQIAFRLLRLHRLSNRFPESPLSGRIHGSQLKQQPLGHHQSNGFHGRM